MKLVSDEVTYELTYKDPGEEDVEKHPVFVMRKLSASRVNTIHDRTMRMEKGNKMTYLSGTSNKMKLDMALVDWRNIQDPAGGDVKCTSANKEKIPAEIQAFLLDDINKTNKLEGYEESEAKN